MQKSTLKDVKMTEKHRDWKKHFEIVYDFFQSQAASKNVQATRTGFCELLGATRGKLQNWIKGQWPSAEDLEAMHKTLGFSYRWLVTGEGDPFDEGSAPREANLSEAGMRIRELERENAALRSRLKDETEHDLRTRLDELETTVKQLQTRLLIDGVGDKDAATGIGKTADGQG